MRFYFLLLLSLMGLNCSAQSERGAVAVEIDSLFKTYNRTDAPGCAVLVVKDKVVVFKKGYGMANLGYNLPIVPASVFDIASVSKQFTGYAIAKLIQQGKVSIDDDIHKYLPEIPQFGKTITIGHLLHHTSGLRDWPSALHIAGWRWGEIFTFEDIMRMVKKQQDLNFEPGSKYSYSNTGYNLLAAIVEKVSGLSFRNWMAANLFKPLGMNSSQVADDHQLVINNLASSYESNGEGFNQVNDALTAYGSSSIYSSVEDLAKWVIYFQQGMADNDPVISRMLEESKLTNGKKNSYCYGLIQDSVNGVKTISHNGGWAAYNTVIVNYPAEQLAVIILSNAGGFHTDPLAAAVAELFLKDKAKMPILEKPSAAPLPAVKVSDKILKNYAGTFKLGSGWYATFTLEKGELMVQANGEGKFPVEAKSDSLFWVPAYQSSFTFVNTNGKANVVKYKGIMAERVIPMKLSPEILNAFTGVFHSPELETDYVLSVVNSKIQVHHMRLGDFDLEADLVSPDLFTSELGAIKFERSKEGKISGFKISSGRVNNLRFDKR
ncbi:serine hydrolase domain-containing protein [Pedobacter antarcticus]|uniref:serine hydrolase domain-containing protein n=1 Tax=Pedobacter antarcticus TaxID=34086 RepID=UPI00292E28AF|nr:serine hydrolase domain-containing protein [Pedobacter antarcticus]